MEDLLEALVADIEEDSAEQITSFTTSARGPKTDGSLVLDGLMRLSQFEELVGVRPDEDDRQVETRGGLVMHRLARVPSVRDKIRLPGWLVRVEGLGGRRARRVRVVPVGAVENAVLTGVGAAAEP